MLSKPRIFFIFDMLLPFIKVDNYVKYLNRPRDNTILIIIMIITIASNTNLMISVSERIIVITTFKLVKLYLNIKRF